MKALDGGGFASYKAGDDLSFLGVLLFAEEHQRAVDHSDILHAVPAHTQVKIIVGVGDICDLMPHQRLFGYDRASGAYLSYYGNHALGKRRRAGYRVRTLRTHEIFHRYSEIVCELLKLVGFRRASATLPVGERRV